MEGSTRPVFLTWIRHRRTRAICSELDFELAEILTRRRGLLRYLLLTFRTIRFLASRRPRTLIVQTPSIVLGALTVLLRRLLRFHLICDAHNEAVDPFLSHLASIRRLSRWLIRSADLTIVTNERLAHRVRELGGTAQVLFDPLPRPEQPPRPRRLEKFTCVVISTYAPDEPLTEIFRAAELLTNDAQFMITGNSARMSAKLRDHVPANVLLTGFLSEEEYWNLLASADLIIDLTLMPDCLVCGSYEAVAVGTPVLLTDTEVSRELFGDAAVYTKNEGNAIAAAIMQEKNSGAASRDRVVRTRPLIEQRWRILAQALLARIEAMK